MKSKLFVLSIVAVFIPGIICFTGTASAWEKGHVKIVPSIKYEDRWDSNIFYDSSDEKDDWISIITPGILGEFGFGPAGKHKARIDYKVDIGIFANYDDQNYGNHDLLGEVKLDFNDYTLTVNDNFLFTSDRAGTEFEHRTLRKVNTFNTILGVDFNKLSFDLGYRHYIVDYHSDLLKSIDWYENSVWTTGYVQVMPKTKALLEYKYGNIQYPDASGRNANAHTVMAGVEGDLTAKLRGSVKAGYKFKGYVDSSNSDFSSAVVHTALDYAATDRLNILFAYEREGFESIYTGNNYYTGDHFITNVNYRFGGNFVARLDGQYFFNHYPEIASGESEKRRDHEWAVGGGLDYYWKEWVVCGIGYRFHQRESNINSRDYDQHVIMSDIRIMF